jgi:hypothetical protein
MVDVIGLELEEARRRLAAAGVTVAAVTETRPPQRAELSGDLRVIRVRLSGETADVVVTRERYVPPAR